MAFYLSELVLLQRHFLKLTPMVSIPSTQPTTYGSVDAFKPAQLLSSLLRADNNPRKPTVANSC